MLNGIEATRCIRSETPDIVYVLGLSGRTDKVHMTTMLRAGASGYLFKGRCTLDELIQAIRETAEGRAYVQPECAELMLRQFRTKGDLPQASSGMNIPPMEIRNAVFCNISPKARR